MSEKKKVTTVTEKEKVQSRYDKKLERRKQEVAKAKKSDRNGMLLGVFMVLILAAFVASFPIRSWLTVNGPYIMVGGKKVTQVEFDHQYNLFKETYWNQMGSYIGSAYGVTEVDGLLNQMYSDYLTFDDYFEQMAVESIVTTRAIMAKAEEAGFTYDASQEVADVKAELEAEAEAAGVSFSKFLTDSFGPLATWERLEPIYEESFVAVAYYQEVAESKQPTEEDLVARYEEAKNDYDLVDYHLTTIKAELPTTAPDGTVETDEEGNEIAYEPTEEEINAAMKEAKKEAEEALKTVTKDGVESVGKKYTSANYRIRDWLFEEGRKKGDTTIIENTDAHQYLVVSFDNRYIDDVPTYDFRMIMTTSQDVDAILEEWKTGEATEESFADLVGKYDEMGAGSYGGLYTGAEAATFGSAVIEWLRADRQEGDVVAISGQEDAFFNYVVYFLDKNEEKWKIEARDVILSERMEAYLNEAKEGVKLEDPKGNLNFLNGLAMEELFSNMEVAS